MIGERRPGLHVPPGLEGDFVTAVDGEPAADRLLRSIDYRRAPQEWRLTPGQVAVVLRALADHTALEAARVHDRTDLHDRTREDPFWPTTISIGRWLHAVADALQFPTEPVAEGANHGRC